MSGSRSRAIPLIREKRSDDERHASLFSYNLGMRVADGDSSGGDNGGGGGGGGSCRLAGAWLT